ncbi:hypothetical protein [Mycolicibacterium phlei]|uniref:hypothetical protein n=1 Tax=Mycolicibacterium phlei TaxID=1771 RepID=UPI0037C8E953
MKQPPPYPWLGCAIPPVLYYSDCGHLLGCSDPAVDLAPIRLERGRAGFSRCMMRALRTGSHGRSTSCVQPAHICEAIDAYAEDPSDENHARAYFARLEYEESLPPHWYSRPPHRK